MTESSIPGQAQEVPDQPVACPRGHSWHDYGQLGGRNVSWCSRCDSLAFTGQEPDAGRPTQAAADLHPLLVLTGYQLRAAAEFVNPDHGDTDQLESEVCIQWGPERDDGEGGKEPAGLRVWLADYPEEGSMALDPDKPWPPELVAASPAAAAGVPTGLLKQCILALNVAQGSCEYGEQHPTFKLWAKLEDDLRAALASPVAPVGAPTLSDEQIRDLFRQTYNGHHFVRDPVPFARALLSRPGCELATDATVQDLPRGELTEPEWRQEELRVAAQAVVDRWDTPLWKDVPHTGEFIAQLRRALSSLAPAPAPS